MYIYIYIYIYIHVHKHTHIHIYIYIYMYNQLTGRGGWGRALRPSGETPGLKQGGQLTSDVGRANAGRVKIHVVWHEVRCFLPAVYYACVTFARSGDVLKVFAICSSHKVRYFCKRSLLPRPHLHCRCLC